MCHIHFEVEEQCGNSTCWIQSRVVEKGPIRSSDCFLKRVDFWID